MTTNDAHHATTRPSPRRRRRALVSLALALSCLMAATAVPAGAAGFKWRWPTTTTTVKATTTTTKAPATTTTVKPTTTTVAPTTTTVAPTTTTAAPTTTTTAPPSSGTTCAPMAKADGSTWQCTFDDEFNGSSLNTGNWVVQTTAASGFHSGAECFVNTPNNVSVAGGALSLTLRKEAAPFTCTSPSGSYSTQYTSGMVMTGSLFGQTYGRFEVRAKLPAAKVKGLQESFWLWPQNPYKYGYQWPISGEIDIAEMYHLYPDRAIPYVHYVPAVVDPNVTNNYCLIDDLSQFHTYTAEWTPTTITIIYDGKVCLTDTFNAASPLTTGQPFDQPFMIALTQALGIGVNAPTASTPLPATTQVDYVRVWK
jgi:beta-glucanase (GH16 family)